MDRKNNSAFEQPLLLYTCSQKGICCYCIAYLCNLRSLAADFYPKDTEWSYDRSSECLAKHP